MYVLRDWSVVESCHVNLETFDINQSDFFASVIVFETKTTVNVRFMNIIRKK